MPNWFFNLVRRLLESVLSGAIGDWLEKKLGTWQSKRIARKNTQSQNEQCYIKNNCLMFHPQAKSLALTDKLARQIEKLTAGQ